MVDAMRELFRTGKMLKILNITVITLILNPTLVATVGDYRLITCCNTVYNTTKKSPKSVCQFSTEIRQRANSPTDRPRFG